MAMTPAAKEVQRLALANGYGPVVVRITDAGLTIRPYRTKRAFLLPWSQAYLRAVRLDTDHQAALKATKRRGKRRLSRMVRRGV